jgi:thymidylate kinase
MENDKPNVTISLTGPAGAGKTVIAGIIAEALTAHGLDVAFKTPHRLKHIPVRTQLFGGSKNSLSKLNPDHNSIQIVEFEG